jgi:hypothetical protein
MGSFIDGKIDCCSPSCPLYPFFPYKEGGSIKTRILSEEQKENARNRLREGRERKQQASEELRGVRRKL